MLKYFIAGGLGGLLIPQYLSNNNFEYLYQGLYRPHKEFFRLKSDRYKKDESLIVSDYTGYIRGIFSGLYISAHYFLLGQFKEFKETKQKVCFDLIENFEFVRETVQNWDYLNRKIRENMEDEKKYTEELIIGVQQEIERLSKSPDEMNLDYIKQIENMTDDEYEKYAITQAIIPKEEYLKNISPDYLLEKSKYRLQIIENFQNSLLDYKNNQNFENKRQDIQNKSNEIMNKKGLEEMHPDKPNAQKKDKKEKPQKLKNIEKELEDLKGIFGEK
jgi:hypothetical protein